MSWQAYVDSNLVGTKKVKMGAILGLDGNVWARSPALNVTPVEGKLILANYKNAAHFAEKGIVIGGVKYMFLRADERSLIGKKGQGGVHVTKTGKALIVGVYDAPTVPSECAVVVEKLADYLVGVGY